MLKLREKHNNENTLWYDFSDGEIKLGQAQIKLVTYDGNNIFYEVLEQYRGKGWGEKLLIEVLAECKRLGFRQLTLLCEKDNLASKVILDKHCGKGIELVRYIYEII